MDIARLNLQWLLQLAREGDQRELAKHLRKDTTIIPDPELRAFIVGLLDGSIKPKRQRKLTAAHKMRRTLHGIREQNVAFIVDRIMGKRRDKAERLRLTKKACEHFGTTPEAVAQFLKHRQR